MRRANQILGGPIYLGLLVQWFALCSPSVSEAEEPVLTRPGRVVTHYALTSAFTGEYPDPRDWLLLGSRDDGQSWEVLDTRTNQIFTERSQRKLFSLTNRTAYSTYRLVVTNTSCVQLAELELMGEMTGAGAEAELPLVASASREHPLLGPADDAFDGKPATRWLDFGAGQGACWLQCQYSARPELVVTNLSGYRVLARRLSARNPLGSRLAAIQSNLTVQAAAPAHKLKGYALTSANDFPGRDPKDWRLLGSNDGGKTWRTLDARRNQVFNGRLQRRSFLFPAPVEYSTYRLQVDSVRLPSGVNSVQLAEVEPLSDNKGHAFSIVVTAQGDNLPTETATAAFDEDATTKWLDFANNDAKARSSWIQWQYIPAEKWPVIDGRWLQALPAAPISTPNLRLDGVVVSWDPKTATLGFLDETEFQLFKLEPMPSSVRVGERARLSGHPEIGWEFPVVSEAELVRLGDLPLLPKETAGLSVGTGPAFFSGTIEGRVVSVSRDPPLADLTLRMGEGQTTVTARVLDSQRALPVFTPGARAQVRGVIQAIFDEQGRRIAGTLWAPGPDSVRLLGGEPPPEPAASARASDWSVPANSIREVYDRLAQSQGKQFSAQVRGVITYIDLGLGSFYLQAGTDGILVNGLLEAGLAPGLGQEGLYVELNGVVTTNQPVIEARGFVKVIGRGRMPEPRPATWDSLLSGKEEGRWVQAPGVVSSCEEHLLTLVVPGGRLVVWVNELDRSAHNRLLGSTVRVNGVCESVRDNRNRRLGVRLLTPSEACIDIVRAAPADPFSLRTRPLGAVIDMESAGSGASRGLIKTAGVVTHWERRLLFIQEGEAGLRVYPRDEEAVEPGDRVEVVGLLEPDGFSPKLARALVRKTGRSPLPRPTPINLLDPDLSDQDATRVTFEAVFLGGAVKESLQVLDFQDPAGTRQFSAFLPKGSEAGARWAAGSRVRLQGVFKAETEALPDVGKVQASFQMYLNSPQDVEVLERPAWWSARHTLFAIGGLGAVLLLSLAWAASLGNQVRRQTEALREKVLEQKRTAAALRDSEGFLRSLMEKLPMNIVRKDLQGRLTFANERFCRTVGKPLAEILGKTDADFYAAELAAKYRQDDEAVIRTGKTLEAVEENRDADGKRTFVHVVKTPVYDAENQALGLQIIFWDVTERKETEARLEAANRDLHEISRHAGMAEVATGVLHNVGNVLNSVNVSATLATENLRRSKVANVSKTAELLREHQADLAAFLTEDPRGQKVINYLGQLGDLLAAEQASVAGELGELNRHIDHIKEIVAMQQHYAKFAGVSEVVKVTDLVEDALLLNAGALSRHDIRLTRDYAPEPILITVEKHKVLQILINLIRNAKYACDESGRTEKRMTVSVARDAASVRISVADNGVGISAENVQRLFTYGFTTRKDGHGFGLHSGAIAAKEMDGALLVQSEGPGRGATFTLQLPMPAQT